MPNVNIQHKKQIRFNSEDWRARLVRWWYDRVWVYSLIAYNYRIMREYCHYYNYILEKSFSLALVYRFHVKFIKCVLNLSHCCRVWYMTFPFVICRNILQFIRFMFKTPVTYRLSVSRQHLNAHTRTRCDVLHSREKSYLTKVAYISKIVSYTPIDRQRPRSKQTNNSCYWATASQIHMFLREQEDKRKWWTVFYKLTSFHYEESRLRKFLYRGKGYNHCIYE
jgi:hypothetical protein